MKLTLEIKDNFKAQAFLDFVKTLGFVSVKESKKTKETALPDWHIAIIQQRLSEYKKNPKKIQDFDKAIAEIEKEL